MGARKSLVGAARFPRIAWSFSRLGYERRARRFEPADLDLSLAGKAFVVTGANSGIGLAIAEGLAERDADVWLLCRNRERGERAATRLDERGTGTIRLELVDMADLASVRALAARVDVERVDGLIHNAGALFDERATSADGLERTFALHVVGPECLTRALLPALRRGRGRVIWVASGGMYAERLSVDELLDPPEPFDGVRAYALAKRAQVVLAELWSAREPGVAFFAMHPGWADTAGVESALPRFYKVTKRWLRTAEQGGDTALWLAACETPPVESGSFVFDRAEAERYLLPGTRAEPSERERLWAVVDRLAASGVRPSE